MYAGAMRLKAYLELTFEGLFSTLRKASRPTSPLLIVSKYWNGAFKNGAIALLKRTLVLPQHLECPRFL